MRKFISGLCTTIIFVLIGYITTIPAYAIDFTQDLDCVGAWKLNETSGNALDICSTDGAQNGTPYFGPVQTGTHYSFDGDNDSVGMGDVTFLDGESNAGFCVHARIQPGDIGTEEINVITKRDSFSPMEWTGSGWQPELWTGGGSRHDVDEWFLDDGQWHSYCYTYEASIRSVYRDGLEISGTFADSGTFDNSSNPFYLGGNGVWRSYKGDLRNVLVLKRALTDTETLEFHYKGIDGVAPGSNQAPVVYAGKDHVIVLPNSAQLDAGLADDDMPTPVNLSSTWSKVSGPGTVSFGDATAASTTASFSQEGLYTLRITADDSSLQTTDDIVILVQEASSGFFADADCVGAWKFDESFGYIAYDLCTTDGVDNGAVYADTNMNGAHYGFAGDDGHVDFGDVTFLDGENEATFCMDAKINAGDLGSGFTELWRKDKSYNTMQWTGSEWRAYWWTPGAANHSGLGNWLPDDSQWHSYCYTYDGTTRTAYRDGAVVGSTYADTGGFDNSSNSLYIGGDAKSKSFKGDIKNVIILKRALSASEVIDIRDNGLGGGGVGDITSPAITNIVPADGSFTGDNTPALSADFSDNDSGVDAVTAVVKLDGADVTSMATVTATGFTMTAAPLNDGAHTLDISVDDVAGNTAQEVTSFSVDTAPPMITSYLPSHQSTVTVARPTVTASYTDSVSGVLASGVILKLDGVNVTAQATITSGILSFTPGFDLANGSHTIELTVPDSTGNAIIDTNDFAVNVVVTSPTLDPVGNLSVDVGSSLNIQLSVSDPTGGPITYGVLPVPLPEGAAFNTVTGLFTFTPALEQIGNFDLTFNIYDGGFTDAETITVFVEEPVPGAPTELTGRLLDTNDYVLGTETPIVGATVSILGTANSTTTAADGTFILTTLFPGSQVLDINSQTANMAPDGSTYSGFREAVNVIEGVTNNIERPIFLPRIDSSSLTTVNPSQTTVVTNAALGVTIWVPPFTAKNQDGSNFTGQLSISEVPEALAPAALPRELDPGLLITIQPVGVWFTDPVSITFPNIDGYPAGALVDIWSVDPDSGQFRIVGTGKVSSDGLFLETIMGGVRAADWHMATAPVPIVGGGTRDDNYDPEKTDEPCTGSRTELCSGSMSERHSIASYRSLGVERTQTLVYRVRQADPQPVVSNDAVLQGPVGQGISSGLAVGGVVTGPDVHLSTAGLTTAPTVISQGIRFDGTSLSTGHYLYTKSLTRSFGASSLTSFIEGTVFVRNETASPFGAGWTLYGLDRLIFQPGTTDVLLSEGSGGLKVYSFDGTPGDFDVSNVVSSAISPRDVAVGDMNGDGFDDVVVGSSITTSSQILIYISNGSGGYTLVDPAIEFSGSLVLGDVNEDGNLDIVTGSGVHLGTGTGNISSSISELFVTDGGLSLNDFNKDGHLDVLGSNGARNQGAVYYGDGTGNFGSGQQLNGFNVSLGTASSGDYNGDGNPDIIATKLGLAGAMELHLGDGAGGFAFSSNIGLGNASNAFDSMAADLNGDGVDEIIVAVVSAFGGSSVRIYQENGAGALMLATSVAVGVQPVGLDVADFDDNGTLDIVATDDVTNQVFVIPTDGALTLGAVVSVGTQGTGSNRVAAGDFENDGIYEFVVTNPSSNSLSFFSNGAPGSPDGDYSQMVDNGDGTYTRILRDGTRCEFDSVGLMTSMVDRNGNTYLYRYNASDQIDEIEDPVGKITKFTYSGGLLTKITDPALRETTLLHDGDGNLVRITDPDGSYRMFGYDSFHRLDSQTSKRGFTTMYTYNFASQLTLAEWPDGSTRQIIPASTTVLADESLGLGSLVNPASLVPQGNVFSTFIDGEGNITKRTFDKYGSGLLHTDAFNFLTDVKRNQHGDVLSVTRPKGNGVVMTYNATNNPRERVNVREIRRKEDMSLPDNDTTDIVTQMTYETQFNQVKTFTDGRGNTTTFLFDYELPVADPRYALAGNVVEITFPQDVDSNNPVVRFEYNSFGQVTKMTDPNLIVTDYTYDPVTGNLKTITEDVGGINALTQIDYDAFGNPDTITDANNHTTQLTYDELNRVLTHIDPLTYLTRITYEPNGDVMKIEQQADEAGTLFQITSLTYTEVDMVDTIIDPLLRPTAYTYDGNQQVRFMEDAEFNITEYTYDDRLQLFQVKDANTPQGVTTTIYDPNQNVETVTDNENNPTTYTYDGFDRKTRITYADASFGEYFYDKNSNMTRYATPSGLDLDYSYDKLNRRITKTYESDSSLNITYKYDLGSRMLEANTTASQIVNIFDGLNRVVSNTQRLNGINYTVGFDYDPVNNRTQVIYPGGKVLDYNYDQNDRLKDIDVNSAPLVQYTYDPLDRPLQKSFLSAQLPVTAYDYDIANQLEQIKNDILPSTNVSTFDYTYDQVSNRLTMTTNAGVHSYTYNDIYELTGVTGVQSHNYTYDNEGNRTIADGVSYVPNLLNQYDQVGGVPFTYDGNDNLSSDGNNAYTYDEFNRLKNMQNAAHTATYQYDAFNRRISKTVDGVTTYFVYDGNEVIEEYNSTGVLQADYVMGLDIDEPLTMSRSGSTYFYHVDGLGSVRQLTNASGTIEESYDYDPYGRVTIFDASSTDITASSSAIGNPYMFTARRYDEESGIYYYRARQYDPAIGRFLQRDPLSYFDSMNLYEYVRGNPTSYIDPLGLASDWIKYAPIVGPAGDAINDFKEGKIGWGIVNTGLAVSDIFLVKAIAMGGTRLVLGQFLKKGSLKWKGGSGVRAWLGEIGFAEKYQHVHHWAIPQRWKWADWITNNMLNLLPMKSPAMHVMVEGKTYLGQTYNWFERFWHGTPYWFKAGIGSTIGRIPGVIFNNNGEEDCY